MKKVEKIWAELSAKAQEVENTQEVELSEEQKVELGAFEDLNAEYKAIASRAPQIKRAIMSQIQDLNKVSDDLDGVEKKARNIYNAAKELGADDLMKKADTLEESSSSLAEGWGDVAVRLESLAKEI
jgi:prophage DNA circulation protein